MPFRPLLSFAFIVLGVALTPGFAQAQPAAACVPKCRSGYTCVKGACVPACNPPCAAGETCTGQGECVSTCNPPCATGEVCSPRGQCVSACNPACPAGQVCTPKGECVSACNPPCAAGETCTAQGACQASAPPAPAPAPAPVPAPAPAPAVGAPTSAPPSGGPLAPTRAGVHTHDGFYFRFGFGFGSLSGTVKDEIGGQSVDGDVSGTGFSGELAFGGTVAPGLALGGGIYGTTIPEPEYEADGVSSDGGAIGISLIAPFADYYFSPTSGFHLQGALGYAMVTAAKGEPYPYEDASGGGVGLMLGVGYEAWVGEQWGLGGLARVLYSSGSVTGDDSDESKDYTGAVFSLLLTTTLH